jgi:hypothetical protein
VPRVHGTTVGCPNCHANVNVTLERAYGNTDGVANIGRSDERTDVGVANAGPNVRTGLRPCRLPQLCGQSVQWHRHYNVPRPVRGRMRRCHNGAKHRATDICTCDGVSNVARTRHDDCCAHVSTHHGAMRKHAR